jgi:NAD+ synthetase
MKILIGEINTTPGDFVGNKQAILDGLIKANHTDADLAVFPEMATCGYLVKDMLYQEGFIEENLAVVDAVATATRVNPKVTVILGYVDRNYSGKGKPFRNMAAVIRNGLVITRYQKRLLPYYDVFDEGRYFEPGDKPCVVEVAGHKCGISICEDIWNDKGVDDYNYAIDPVDDYRKLKVDTLINISASPYVQGKPSMRTHMLRKIADDFDILVYVNQVGGQDELVFDGHSTIIDKHGMVQLTFCPSLEPGVRYSKPMFRVLDTNDPEDFLRKAPFPESELDQLYVALIIGLQDYVRKSGFKEVVIGSSGGIDSAVTAALACRALGPENVHCIMMPGPYSSKGSIRDAQKLHELLGCHEHKVPINSEDLEVEIFNALEKGQTRTELADREFNTVASENIQARMRGLVIMHFSNGFGALPLATGNKTELAVGYCTLYGDMNGGFNVIGDLYKKQVYQLAAYLNQMRKSIPEAIMAKAPSAELKPNQRDEEALMPYLQLDLITKAFIEDHITTYLGFYAWLKKGVKNYPMFELHKFDLTGIGDKYDEMIRRIVNAEFKRRQACPCVKVSKVAFGIGRRLPIVQG